MVPRIEGAWLVDGLRRGAYAGEYVVHHTVQAKLSAVLGCIDALDAMPLQSFDLVRRDRSAAAYDHANVLAATLPQHVHHVGEVFVVTALIRACGDRVRVLLDRGPDDLRDAAVVAEVDDLGAVGLQQAADHVDRRVMTVEERGRGDESQRRRQLARARSGEESRPGRRCWIWVPWGVLACKLAAEGILYLYAPVEWLLVSMVQSRPRGQRAAPVRYTARRTHPRE